MGVPWHAAANGIGFEPVTDFSNSALRDEKTLFAHCSVKEKGICAKKRCGGRLTSEDLLTESTFKLAGRGAGRTQERCHVIHHEPSLFLT